MIHDTPFCNVFFFFLYPIDRKRSYWPVIDDGIFLS
jgi:hypothetical protein